MCLIFTKLFNDINYSLHKLNSTQNLNVENCASFGKEENLVERILSAGVGMKF
jgi:hypothetical protein